MKVTMQENTEKNGIELFFPGPLSLSLSQRLRKAGWRFARRGAPRWYTKFTESQWAFGESIVQRFNPATDLSDPRIVQATFNQPPLAKAA